MLSGGTAVLYVPGTRFDEGAAVSIDGKTETSPPISLSGFFTYGRPLFTVEFTVPMLII
jgi:hypothetical protein